MSENPSSTVQTQAIRHQCNEGNPRSTKGFDWLIQDLHNLDNESAVEELVERIFDASKGYKQVHAFAMGTPKAPGTTELWHKGQYIGHPHQLALVYLEEWVALRCQFEHLSHDQLWSKMKELIKLT